MKRIAIAAALSVFGIGAAFAQTYKVGAIEVAHPWAPPMTGSKLTNSAAYMRLIDRGTVSDQLVSATSPVAQKVELHVFNVEKGVYGMHPSRGLGSAPVQLRRSLNPGVRM
jgi:hypothetical protein